MTQPTIGFGLFVPSPRFASSIARRMAANSAWLATSPASRGRRSARSRAAARPGCSPHHLVDEPQGLSDQTDGNLDDRLVRRHVLHALRVGTQGPPGERGRRSLGQVHGRTVALAAPVLVNEGQFGLNHWFALTVLSLTVFQRKAGSVLSAPGAGWQANGPHRG